LQYSRILTQVGLTSPNARNLRELCNINNVYKLLSAIF
jgi:hypothetical protein